MKRALLVLLLAACDPVDVVVAQLPDGGELPPMRPCADDTDCHENELCEKPSCTALHGGCRLRPLCVGMNAYAPVCGCNGVTYWNDCWRQADRSSASVAGECGSAKTCSSAADCSPSPLAVCARVSTVSCPSSGATGACWGMPPECPSGQSTTWQACAGGACLDLCAAIKSEQPALLKASCP